MVIGHQNRHFTQAILGLGVYFGRHFGRSGCQSWRSRHKGILQPTEWEPEREARTHPQGTLHLHIAAQATGEATRNRQTQTSATKAARDRRIGLRKRIKKARERIRRNPDSGIDDGDFQPVTARRVGHATPVQSDLAARGELDRVTDQVDQNLPHPIAITDHEWQRLRATIDNQGHTLARSMGAQ